jgi:DNA-binding beta-propeller fold protein YncE
MPAHLPMIVLVSGASALPALAQPPQSRPAPSAPAVRAAPTTPAAPEAPGPYHTIKTWSVGGDGGWDIVTVDPDASRLYLPRGTRVMVLDTTSGQQVGVIEDTAGVHGVAIAPALGRGFTSNGRANTSTVFDLKTLKSLGTVKTGTNPDMILFEPTTKQVFAFNGRSKDATVFNAETLEVTGTVPLGGKPEFAADDGHGHIFVNLEDTGEAARLNAETRTVEKRWPLAPGTEPTGLALDAEHHRLFSACGNEMMVITDTETGAVLATPKIGKGPDGAAFDPVGGFALTSNGDGTLTVIGTRGDTPFQVVQTLTTAPRARTMALDPGARRVYLPTAEFEPPKEGATGRPTMKPGTFKILVVGP